MASRALSLGLRLFQAFCALIIMALVGNMIATAIAGNPSIVNYNMFVAVFGMLSVLYLIATTFLDSFESPLIATLLDSLNTLFWLCGGIATAAYLGVHSCANDAYTKSNFITNGSLNREKRCREAQASTAFMWFGFVAWTLSLFFSFRDGRAAGINMRGSIRGGGRSTPAMSQV